MENDWQFQVRVYLDEAMAELARLHPGDPLLGPLTEILERHDATLKSQFDAFADYVAEAERNGPENYPLYRWTRLTIDDPDKRAKHSRAFAIRLHGNEVYSRADADRLEQALAFLVGAGIITRVSKHDTNPANNIPVPTELR